MIDHVRIDDLHARCKIVSLEQRRQLLLLMYKKSKDVMLRKIFPKNTRGSTRIVLRLDNTRAWAIEVYPSLLLNQVSEHVDLYIKLKLVIFSFI